MCGSKKPLSRKLKTIFIFLFAGYAGLIMSQSPDRYLEIRARAELEMQPLKDATVNLYRDNSKVNSVRTGSDGMFSFKLDMNSKYTIEVTKEGFVSKRLSFDTSIPDDIGGIWVREFSISVLRNCDGVDYSALKDPVDIIKYNSRRKDFDSDKDYVYKMESKIDNIFMQYDKCMNDKYKNLIDKADREFNYKSYEDAKKSYQAALEVFQDEAYPQKRIEELNQLLSKQESIENVYSKTIGEADALYAQKRYQDALFKYKGATTLKPDETYPREKADEIESLLAKNQVEQQAVYATESQYNNLVARGTMEMNNKNYEAARQLLQSAFELKPGDPGVQSKITELDRLIAEKAGQDAKQQTVNSAYNNAIAQGDNLFAAGNYNAAKDLYKKAASLKPGESYPAARIAEIDKTVQNLVKTEEKARLAELEKQYQAALAEGDNLYRAKDYNGAAEAYNKALALKPGEQYPLQRVNQINSSVAAEEAKKQRDLQAGYQSALAAAEKAIAENDYQSAKNFYLQAQQFKPDDAMLKTKVQEAEKQIAQLAVQKRQQESAFKQYNVAIQKADQLFTAKDYSTARTAYQQAHTIKPDEQYPLQRIQEIERLISIAEAQKLREMESGYQNAVNAANGYYMQKSYVNARKSYQEALTYKPDDNLAKSRILEINNLISKEQVLIAAEQAKKKQYDELIARADGYFTGKDYPAAKAEYQKASQMLPAEQYPRQRIDEIGRLEAEQQRTLAEQQAKDNAYSHAVSNADGFFTAKQYEQAKAEYNKALTIKPDETHPKNRLTEIDRTLVQLEQEKTREQNFSAKLLQADRLLAEKQYTESRLSYTKALEIKPNEAYPKSQIAKIDNLVAEAEKARKEELAKQQKYDALIAQADKLYDGANYQGARENYQKALEVKPDEAYPKARIAKINESLTLLAQQQKQTSTATQKPVTNARKALLAELKFKDDDERDKYLFDLKKRYPAGVTEEVYKESNKVTTRVIVIRNDEAREFRLVHFPSWGGREYTLNGKPITQMFYEDQVKPRDGEYYKKSEF